MKKPAEAGGLHHVGDAVETSILEGFDVPPQQQSLA